MASDNDQILAIHQEWIDAERLGDLQSITDLCSNDIQFFPPSGPGIRGKDAVLELLQAGSHSIQDIQISDIHIEVGGTLAYKTARFVTYLQSSPGGGVTTIQGNHLWVLRREDSQWRIVILAWSIL